MNVPHTFSWRCPSCQTVHGWTWEKDEVPIVGQFITMRCPACSAENFMKCELVKP